MSRVRHRKLPKLTATYRCGHTFLTNTPATARIAEEYDCDNCRAAKRLAYEAEHGHTHSCSCCATTAPIVTGCHCDNESIWLVCENCKQADAESRRKIEVAKAMWNASIQDKVLA